MGWEILAGQDQSSTFSVAFPVETISVQLRVGDKAKNT